jgi:hypothetical protein
MHTRMHACTLACTHAHSLAGRLVRPEGHHHHRHTPRWRRVAGMFASFLTSAAAHEYILWALQPDGLVTWKWFTFFAIQARFVWPKQDKTGLKRAKTG